MFKWILGLLAIPLILGLVFLLLMGNPQSEFEPERLRQFRLTMTGEYLGYVGHGLWHPHLLVSGANNAEHTLPLPGDKLILNPKMQMTRAITIDAPAKDIWPWLLQMGYGRGGWYAWSPLGKDREYGEKITSADKILPEYQQLNIGHILLEGPDSDKRKGIWIVKMLYQDRALVLYSAREIYSGKEIDPKGPKPTVEYIVRSRAFLLEPIDARKTRLVLRTRIDTGPAPSFRLNNFILRLGDTARERSILDGIKERVELANKAPTIFTPGPDHE